MFCLHEVTLELGPKPWPFCGICPRISGPDPGTCTRHLVWKGSLQMR